jgi:hypothetical protein
MIERFFAWLLGLVGFIGPQYSEQVKEDHPDEDASNPARKGE